ncbi:hypothetical protein [Nitrosopumilus sp.]|uniref:hypothetical protein n=1 Tax=Nitrosopumilus sp. TaxID=2024843 RepID=UPI00247D4802|nr:hypothetical protein [Nitrosopumilus sp.]MCV0431674.1 hypothetical protein [Nitrosopumilus sp.]
MKRDTEISKIWVTGKSSYTMVIPKKFALDLKLDSESYLVIEKTTEGLIIKKLEVGHEIKNS